MIKLRDDEQIKYEVNFHWSNYLASLCAALLFTTFLIIQLSVKGSPQALKMLFLAFSLGSWLAVGWAYMRNKTKCYVITNKRLYLEFGILSKKKSDIPIDKISDVEMHQSFKQRLFGAGDIMVLLGGNVAKKISDIDNPEAFKEAISTLSYT